MTRTTDILSQRGTRRLRLRYSPRRWPVLGETLATLTIASAAIRLLPFRYVAKLADRGLTTQAPHHDISMLLWAVEAWARLVPWRTVCFQKGLALHLMLRRRGIPSVLHYGVGRGDENGLAAHVWISVGGEIVIGGDVADRFHCLATYPKIG